MGGRNISNIISGEGYDIYIDDLKRIRVKIDDPSENNEILDRVIRLAEVVNRIDSLPLDDDERIRYQKDIANIYQIGLVSSVELALNYANELRNEIERNLIIRKKQVLFLPVVIGYIIIILTILILCKYNIIIGASQPIIYGSIGGLLSVIFQNNKLEIDYYVADKLLYFESFKLIVLSNVMAIIGYVAIKSEFLLGSNFNNEGAEYLRFLVYIICGYSQTFVPSILKNFELQNGNREDKK